MYNKDLKKAKQIIIGSLIFIMFLIFMSCGLTVSAPTPEPEKTLESTPKIEKNETSKPEKTITSTKPEKTPENLLTMDMVLDILKTSYKGIADIKYDKKENIIKIIPKDKYFMYGVLLAKNGDPASIENWKSLKESLITISKQVKEIKKNTFIAVINNQNTDKHILTIVNGECVYDILNDKSIN
ncbi:MAG: hypothetical protein JXB50_08130 [Spirochaetes bacterium]|nr:hypothetical protein [Spirochaetota bacterium]